MPMRIVALFILLAPACSDTRPRSHARDAELMPFEAPVFASQRDELEYLWAQLQRYINDQNTNTDMNFDSWLHVSIQFNAVAEDLSGIDYSIQKVDPAWPKRVLSRTPEILHYRGARQNAVALGILALSIWRRDPEREQVTIGELEICASPKRRRRCRTGLRTLALQRMMLMAEHADARLFDRLKQQMPPLRAMHPRPKVIRTAPPPARTSTPDSSEHRDDIEEHDRANESP